MQVLRYRFRSNFVLLQIIKSTTVNCPKISSEFIADIFLCPYEACRIRLVSNPTYASSMADCAKKMMSESGFVGAFYSGFVPILFKQIPYTMA